MSSNKVEISRLCRNDRWMRLDIRVYLDDKKFEKRLINFANIEEDQALKELWERCSEITELMQLKSRVLESFLEMRKYNIRENTRTIYFELQSSCSKSENNEEKPANNTSKDNGETQTEATDTSIDSEETECSQEGCVGSLSTKKEVFHKNFYHVITASRNEICSKCRKKL